MVKHKKLNLHTISHFSTISQPARKAFLLSSTYFCGTRPLITSNQVSKVKALLAMPDFLPAPLTRQQNYIGNSCISQLCCNTGSVHYNGMRSSLFECEAQIFIFGIWLPPDVTVRGLFASMFMTTNPPGRNWRRLRNASAFSNANNTSISPAAAIGEKTTLPQRT